MEILTADCADSADKDIIPFLGRMDLMNLIHEELSREIIGAAMQVLNTLKPGLDEKIYENALVLELEGGRTHDRATANISRNLSRSQCGNPNPRSNCGWKRNHRPEGGLRLYRNAHAQMVGYLAITGLHLAILINFKNAKLEWKRIVRQDPTKTHNRGCRGFHRASERSSVQFA